MRWKKVIFILRCFLINLKFGLFSFYPLMQRETQVIILENAFSNNDW